MADPLEDFFKDNSLASKEENAKVQPEETKQEEVVEVKEPSSKETQETTTNIKEESSESNEKDVDAEKTSEFDINSFNSAFKTEYQSLEEIQSLFNSKSELEKASAALTEKDTLIQEKEELLSKKVDVLSYFPNKNEYIASQVLIKNPDANASAVRKIVNSDLKELSELEVLKLSEMVKYPIDVDPSIIEKSIKDRYGIGVDVSEMEGDELTAHKVKEYAMQKDAVDARKKLGELVEGIEVPEKIDIAAQEKAKSDAQLKAYEESVGTWTSKTNEIVGGLDKFSVDVKIDGGKVEKYEIPYDNNFKEYITANLPKYAASIGLDVNKPEDLARATEAFQKDFWWAKRADVLTAYKKDLLSKTSDEEFKKYHNPAPENTAEAPDVMSDEQKKNKEADEKIGGWL
jgi:hypothetical protein